MTGNDKNENVSESWAFLDSLIENLPNMVFVKDANELRFVRFNKAGEELLGYTRKDLLGKNDYDFFPKEQADFFITKDRAVLSQKMVVDIPEEPIQTAHKGTRLLHTKKIPLFDLHGKPQFLLGISEDITERRQADEERLRLLREETSLKEREKATKRLSLLAEISTALAQSLDYQVMVSKIVELSVNSLCDWATVAMLDDDGKCVRLAAAHRDRSKEKLIEELQGVYPVEGEPRIGTVKVVQTGESIFAPMLNDMDLRCGSRDQGHFELIRKLGCCSSMTVAIQSRGKIYGALSFISGTRHFDHADLAMAEEIGRRAGFACENALLFQKAQKAVKLRDDFLSIASHELKTPLTSLKLQIQLAARKLEKAQTNDSLVLETAKALKVSDRQIVRLTNLVDDLLDVSRIQAGKLEIVAETIDLSTLVKHATERYADQFGSEGIEFSVEIDPDLQVKCDSFRFEQVVENLLGNALKYGEKSPVQLQLKGFKDRVSLQITDRGMGVPPQMQAKIFERFERAVPFHHISGLGLGLYIVRSIVEAHQGTVRVQSEVGKGSCFIVELPRG